MNKRPATALAALAIAGALTLTGCQGHGGAGTTTIIQQPPAANNTPASTTTSTKSVTALNDGREICHQVLSNVRDLSFAIHDFWKTATTPNWSYTDPKTEEQTKRVQDEGDKTFPVLEKIVGPNAPSDVADAVKTYAETAKSFSDAVTEGQTGDSLNSAASKFGHAEDSLKATCKVS